MNVGNCQGGQPLRTHSAAKRGFNLFMPVKLRSAQIREQSDQGHIYAYTELGACEIEGLDRSLRLFILTVAIPFVLPSFELGIELVLCDLHGTLPLCSDVLIIKDAFRQ